jgi:hypothetical protein
MDDFLSRTELSPVDRTVVRGPAPAQAVQPVAASRASDGPDTRARTPAPRPEQADIDQDLASVAEYVEVHARIAEILSDLDSGAISVDDANSAVQGMIPKPIVIVPLPPASREQVEHAAAVAKRIVERAAYAHAAQAHLPRHAVEQIAAS